MQLTVDQVQSRVPVTILAIQGDLDASNYEQVIAKAHQLYQAGTRHLLLDLGAMPFMGSSGVVALHSVSLLMRGEQPPDPQGGWQAFHSIDQHRTGGAQANVKLLNPQPKVNRTLQMTSMSDFFEIYTEREAAIASF
ncbi:MAG TPA: STAS domain-containing protein [Roseiflexaceae bacterium]|nr:STAS domain-containing protein [Roseiflexaceae bacterium]